MLLKILVATVSTDKAAFAHAVDVKGPGEDRYVAQRLVGDVCWLGYTRVLLRSDNGPAILKLRDGSFKAPRVGVEMGEAVDATENLMRCGTATRNWTNYIQQRMTQTETATLSTPSVDSAACYGR